MSDQNGTSNGTGPPVGDPTLVNGAAPQQGGAFAPPAHGGRAAEFDPMLDAGPEGAGREYWPPLETQRPGPTRRGAAPVAVAERYDPRTDPLSPDFYDPYYDPDEWVRLPKRSSLARRSFIVLTVVVLVIIAGFWAANRWLQQQLDPPGPEGDVVLVDIPNGATDNDVVRILADEGVVANSVVTQYYMRYKGAGDFQAGEYQFRMNSAVWDVRDILDGGPLPPVFQRVTIPEGLWLTEIEARLLDEFPRFDPDELAFTLRDGSIRSPFQPAGEDNLEGLLFPATYEISDDEADDERAMIQRLVNTFGLVANEVDLVDGAARLGLTPYEVVIVASMIEEEALLDEDRPKIARVIYNRLEQGTPLGIDATIIYGLGEHTDELTVSQLERDTPYNTRINVGLPPTPISAPGRASLLAALNPEEGPWTFYVLADFDGSHFFTDNFDEFNRVAQESRDAGIF